MPLDQEPATNPFIHDEGIHVINLEELRLSPTYQSASRNIVDDFEQDMNQPYYASELKWVFPRP